MPVVRKGAENPLRWIVIAISLMSIFIVSYTIYSFYPASVEHSDEYQDNLRSIDSRLKRRADQVASKEFENEVLDGIDRLEKLTKGILQSQLTIEETVHGTEPRSQPEILQVPEQKSLLAPRRYAVVGLAKDIAFLFLYRFARSLRESCDPSIVDFILLTDASTTDPEFQWLFKEFSVQVESFAVDTLPASYRNYHPSSYRWILIRDWMKRAEANGNSYHSVLFTDVRDTIFQANPFTNIKENGFYAFLEAKPGTIANCGWNSGWVKDCFGADGLSKVGHNVISCSGTSMATWREAMVYANLLADEVSTNQCERNGVDQGMHNFFLYGGKLQSALGDSPIHIISNENGWIATVQSMPTLTRDRGGYVLNADGKRVAVVHQYDRSDALKDQYAKQFVLVPENERNRK